MLSFYIVLIAAEYTIQFLVSRMELAGGFDFSVRLLYVLIPILFSVTTILFIKFHRNVAIWFSRLWAFIKKSSADAWGVPGPAGESLEELIRSAGYAYDPVQDIFYSIHNPWQKNYGYCRLYDEAAALVGLILDCEPVYFDYDGKKWLIEFWKGQYYLMTGCEIGVYTTGQPEIAIPGLYTGSFYQCATETDYLQMAYSLSKNNKILFTRADTHWWLTGFKPGEFSEPSGLAMEICITLKDESMRQAFVNGLVHAGYAEVELFQYENTVSFVFGTARTPQPYTRVKEMEDKAQRQNKSLCDKYREVIAGCSTLQEKITAVRKKAPDLYRSFLQIGKPKQLFDTYDRMKSYLPGTEK